MKLKISIISFLLSMISYHQLSAQTKAFPGFYISSVGDTIKGVFSNYKQWRQNPTRVAFIESATSKQVVLTPENCVKFIINDNDEYLAYSGPRIENTLQDLQLVNNREASSNEYQYRDVVAFLRLLSRSKEAELYVFSDKHRMNLFYRLRGQPITELKYKKIYQDNQINDVEDFKQQLSTLFALQISGKNLTRSLEKLAYKESEMMEFFDNLFQTEKPTLKKDNKASGWVLSAGVSINTGKAKYDQPAAQGQEFHSSSVSPLLSIGYFFDLPRSFNKYFFLPEIKVYKYGNLTGVLDNGTFKHTTTFKSDFVVSLELNTGVNLINQEKFNMYISGGGGMKYLANNKIVKESFVLPDTAPYSSLESDITKMSYIWNLSAGATFQKKLVIIVSYNLPTLIGDHTGSNPKLGGIQLRAGYKFH